MYAKRKQKHYLRIDYKKHFYVPESYAVARITSRCQRDLLLNQVNEIRGTKTFRKRNDLKVKFFNLYYKYRKNQNFLYEKNVRKLY